MNLGNQDTTVGMGLGDGKLGVGRRRAGTKEGGIGEKRRSEVP